MLRMCLFIFRIHYTSCGETQNLGTHRKEQIEMKYVKLLGLILCLIVMGCTRTGDVLMPPSPSSLTGTWVLQTLNGMSLDMILNADTDENVNNTTQNLYTFNEDGSWTFDLEIHTTFTDEPSLKMVNHVSYIGT